MAKRAAIILAGGKAERFQVKEEPWKDKALAMLFGKPILIHIIERIRDVTEEIVVCVDNKARRVRFSKVLNEYSIKNVTLCIDIKIAHVGGPIVAILTGLKSASADYCAILPCDVPLIQPTVLDYLFNAVRDSYLAVPIWPDGRLESLMWVCERPITLQIAETLCKLRRRRPDDIIRGASKVLFVSTVGDLKNLDPEFKSFVNINFREDLVRLPTRVVQKGPFKENLPLNVGFLRVSELKQLKAAARHYSEEKFLEAARIFSSSSNRFESNGLNFWAAVSKEKEGESLFSLSAKQSSTELRKDYYTKGRVAFMKAAQNYASEAETYAKNQIGFLAKRARTDQSWCQTRANAGPPTF